MTRSIKFSPLLSAIYFSNLNYAFSSPYFEGNVIYPALIEEPLKAESEERQKEIEQIIALQNSVNIEDLKQAYAEYSLVPEHLIKPLE